MNKSVLLILLCYMFSFSGCDLIFECKANEQPEINFEFIVWGYVEVKEHISKKVITEQWKGRELKSPVYKYYCGGKMNGPFTNWYKVGDEGYLDYEGLGTWSFRMDNELDVMRVHFEYDGIKLGYADVTYIELAKFDGGTANLKFKVEIQWDTQNSKLTYSSVTRDL